ncbi:MAG: EF-P beta-lysylation protein EpmB [Thalassobium sp.]|nr:MAG: EF-P beta-lysylation protein EpmB [Thalassobium sp.]
MPIITRSAAAVEAEDWQQILAQSFRRPQALLEYLNLPLSELPQRLQACDEFSMLVPRPYAAQMQPGDADDPLLLQVLPQATENEHRPGYITDPLAEKDTNIQPGIIHKYRGRILLLATAGCAVNCRYCFRRHFAYADNRIGRKQWAEALAYVAADAGISEVILSGGDPLLLQDEALQELIHLIEDIPHVRRLRIHTRLPVVIPQRLTTALQEMLHNSRLQTSIVVHINHPNELSEAHRQPLQALRQSGTTLLNQAVLLRKVNNNLGILSDLSERLFEFGVLPYYLHLLDSVRGAHHFDVSEQEAVFLYRQLLAELPGYLVPRLVREEAGKANKSPINLDR